MGFLQPSLPELDLEEWRRGTRNERMQPLARHFAEIGFGTPDVVVLAYVLKIGLYLAGGMAFALTSEGIDGFFAVGSWWNEPIVFQKVVLWTLLFEVLGLGCGFGPLNLRFLPPLGSFLYWLRPGTIRMPPWPGRVPLTAGDRRSPVDVLLYAGLLAATTWTLLGDGTDEGLLPASDVAVVLCVLAVLGLRDKTIFLAARSEIYATLALTFLLTTVTDQIVAAQLVFVAIWWGAATSKLNRHFPFVVAAMMTNSPMTRGRRMKRRFHRGFPDDLLPSGLSTTLAHVGTAVEFAVPLVLLLSDGGPVTTVAAVVMIAFHLQILTSFPMGVPLEWNVFMIFGIGTLFVDKSTLGPGDLADPLPVVALMTAVVGTVVVGNLFPQKVSFLPAMRYYAGNWDTSIWCFTPAALEKYDAGITKATVLPHLQLTRIYGEEMAEIPLFTGYAFRAFHTHGRALFALIPRACGEDHDTSHVVMDGELVAGTTLGWNFGDGHLHGPQLIAAIQARCHFEPGEVRVVMLHAQPIHRQTQQYLLWDAATGEVERGEVRVSDLVSRQPCDTGPADHGAPVTSAVVVGAGPNGLAAAVALAQRGVAVTVLEASPTIGGGTRTEELTVPGVLHDVCSASHPFGVASPFLASLPLTEHGLHWRWAELDLAHPLDEGTAGVMQRSIAETARGLGEDGPRWRGVFGPLTRDFDALADDVLGPILHWPGHPVRFARFGVRAGLPATVLARRFRTEAARSLFMGCAAHMYRPLHGPATASVGTMLIAAGHARGWPVAEGGSAAITRALASLLTSLGGTVETGIRVRSLADLPAADVRLFDTSPADFADIAGTELPVRPRRALRRWRYGPAAYKLDLAVRDGVPWTAPEARVAGVVHVGGTAAEIVEAEAMVAAGRCRTDRSCWWGSSTSPTPRARPATCTRCGPTRTCRTPMPATSPSRCSTSSSGSLPGSGRGSSGRR